MQTDPTRIEIDVPPVIARRFRSATPEQRARVTAAVMLAMMSPDEADEELTRLLDAVGAEAQANGLTEEKLAELLRDES